MNDWDQGFDNIAWRYSFTMGSPRRMHAVIRPEPGDLPKPLEDAANAMYDAKTDAEAKAAANAFLVLSEEWTTSHEPSHEGS